jgi:hypothetical protein
VGARLPQIGANLGAQTKKRYYVQSGPAGLGSRNLQEETMFKHILITAAITGLIAVALSIEASARARPPGFGQMTCRDAAKADFPNDRKMRRAFKKECKAAYKARAST